MKILEVVNSFVDRQSNIGVRTGHIIRSLHAPGICICRGAKTHAQGFKYYEMGLLGHLPRLLNAVRIYLAPRFNHRKWDIALFEWFAMRKLKKILKDTNVTVAHVWDACPKVIGLLKAEGIPVVLDMPMAPSSYGERLYNEGKTDFLRADAHYREMEKVAIATADLLMAPSEFVAQELKLSGVPEEKIAVVPFGVDAPQNVQRGRQEKKGLDFCFVGNVNRRKGVKELLEAWSETMFSEDRLHLCGRVNPEVKTWLDKVSGNVKVHGFVNSIEYLPKCDVFVLPSWMEGSAKAVYEAMACGLPAIVTHSTGSIVRDGVDGFVIDAGNMNALKDRMLWFKENPEKSAAMGNNARVRASEFTWEGYAKRVVQCYEK